MLELLRLNGFLENEEDEYSVRRKPLQVIEEFEETLEGSIDNCTPQTNYQWIEEWIVL